MKILLSPAKTIDTSRQSGNYNYSVPVMLKETGNLVSKLKKMNAKKLAKMMGVSMDIAELNEQRYKNWIEPKEKSGDIIPAGFAFSGEVYRGLDIPSLNEEELKRANESIRILSGLYGVLKPLDLMYPYRLEMGTTWAITPKTKNLYQFWGKKISLELIKEIDKDEVIVNLASSEYFKAVDKKAVKRRIITPVFKEFKNGEFKIVMMYAKHARGAMARYIVQLDIQDVEQLKLYDVDGYSFNVNLSTDEEWVFTR